jgi:hypothetical protein
MTVSTSAVAMLTSGMLIAFLLGFGGGVVSKFDPMGAIRPDQTQCINLSIAAPGLTLYAPNGQQVAKVGGEAPKPIPETAKTGE